MESDGNIVGYALLTKTYSREAGGLNIWGDPGTCGGDFFAKRLFYSPLIICR